jgi:RNA polymerase sigma-70 factor (ECF subfamily)
MTQQTSPRISERQFEEMYEQYFDLLMQIAEYKFGVPDTEAETLVHDVLFGYIRKCELVLDLRSWLIGAICHASRHYWRLNRRNVAFDDEIKVDRADPASLRIMESLTAQIAAREALDCLAPRYREILKLRYFEGCTVPEIAERLGIKAKYAQKLITRGLRRAERLYGEKGRPK